MPDIFIAHNNKEKKVVSDSRPKPGKKESGKRFVVKSRGGLFSAFCYQPKNVDFETKDGEEKIILLLRRHPITNIGWILISMALILAPILLNFFPILSFLPPNFRFIAILCWYLITIAFVLENFLTWFFNVDIITDERIVDIDFHNLIYKEISDANIDKIQDVTYRMGGAIRTVFNYGDVLVQTASEVPNFEFLAIPNPAKVVKILQDLRVEEEQEKLEGRVR